MSVSHPGWPCLPAAACRPHHSAGEHQYRRSAPHWHPNTSDAACVRRCTQLRVAVSILLCCRLLGDAPPDPHRRGSRHSPGAHVCDDGSGEPLAIAGKCMVQPLLNRAAVPTIRKADLLPGWLQCPATDIPFLHLTMEQWAIAQPNCRCTVTSCPGSSPMS